MKRLMVALLGVMFLVGLHSGGAKAEVKGDKKEKGETKEAVEIPQTAKVTVEQAIKTALEKVQGKVIEAELTRKHDRTVWEVDIVSDDGKVTIMHIDADTGDVVSAKGKKMEKRPGGCPEGPPC